LRHTFKGLLILDGTSSIHVRDQIGHSSTQIKVDIDRIWSPLQRLLVDRLEGQRSLSGLCWTCQLSLLFSRFFTVSTNCCKASERIALSPQ